MGYSEKDGRLYDQNGSDMGPAKARLDSDRTAIGETRVIQHLPGNNPDLVCRDKQFLLVRKPEIEDRNGKRTALWKEGRPTIQERLNGEEIRAKIEAEERQIEQDRSDAPKWVIGLIDRAIKIYLAAGEVATGHAFVRNGVYLSALLKGKAALEKTFAEESKDHDCRRDGCPTGQGCDLNG